MFSNEDSRAALLLLLLLLLFLQKSFIFLFVLPLPLLEATKRSQSPRPDPISLLLLVVGVVGVVLGNVAVVLVAGQVRVISKEVVIVDVWELLEEGVRGGWDMRRELDVRAARLLLSLAEQPLLTFRLLCARYHFSIVPGLFFTFPIFAFLEFCGPPYNGGLLVIRHFLKYEKKYWDL